MTKKKVVPVSNTLTCYLNQNYIMPCHTLFLGEMTSFFLILPHNLIGSVCPKLARARENTILTKADFRALKRDRETTTTMYFHGF